MSADDLFSADSGGLRRTLCGLKKSARVRGGSDRIRSGPPSTRGQSARKSAKKVRQCPPMSAKDILTNVRQSPPRTIIRRGQLSAADKVRKNFSKKNLHRNNTRRTIVRRRTMFAADMSAARGQMSAIVRHSRTNVRGSRTNNPHLRTNVRRLRRNVRFWRTSVHQCKISYFTRH